MSMMDELAEIARRARSRRSGLTEYLVSVASATDANRPLSRKSL